MGFYIIDTDDLDFNKGALFELANFMHDLAQAMSDGDFTINDNGLANEQMRQVLIKDVKDMARRFENTAPYIQPRPIKNYAPRRHDETK